MRFIDRIYIVFAAVLLLLSGASCQKEESYVEENVSAGVSLTVRTSSELTRGGDIADGSNVDILFYEIYGSKPAEAAGPLGKGSVDRSDDGAFHLDIDLIKNQTYNFIFWAQVKRDEGKEHYVWEDLRRIYVKTFADEYANDESRAAFFASEQISVEDKLEKTITLVRPFAQLNLGTDSYETSLNQTEALKVLSSTVTVTGQANTFNTLKKVGEAYPTFDGSVTFAAAPTPNGERDVKEKILEVNDINYHWLGMNYLIVKGESDNITVDINFQTTHGNVDLSIGNVPVKQNHRTNIIGNLLTSDAIFKIVVEEGFEKSDIIVSEEE